MELKDYQKNTLKALQTYLEAARIHGPERAFEMAIQDNPALDRQYKPVAGLEDVPYVCLRLPGKTVLASHSIYTAARGYLEEDYPVVLWMVPTNTIREQTRDALKKPGHPYRQAIDDAFDGRVSVFDVSEIEQIRPQDLTERVCVVVCTLATLRVKSTEGRHVYAHKECFEPHFSRVPQSASGLERIEDGPDKGKIKFSFANLLHLHRPLLIVDEAHNAITELTHEVWQRIRPKCIIEFTATPVTNNVLYRVSATELKAAEMIKLPIMLTEHQNWQEALHDAVLTVRKLQEIAKEDRDFIRPIALIQAESKDRELTVEVVRKHLIENEKIEPERIAVATGSQRELDGVNLLDPGCKIDYVITMEALKEGWDCPFAYVFCSVANIHSSKDVEQFLGRVLRMPHARKREKDELNRAYANVSSPSFAQAARLLHDRLVEKMGFDEEEAREFIQREQQRLFHDKELPLFGFQQDEPLVLTFYEKPDFEYIGGALRDQIEVTEDGSGQVKVIIKGEITEELEEELAKAFDKGQRNEIKEIIKTYLYYKKRKPSPAEMGETFTVPRLCLMVQGELELAEKELILDLNAWNLLDYPAELTESEFSVRENSRTFELDIRGSRLVYSLADESKQIDLSHIHTTWTDLDLVRSLDRELRQPDIRQEVMLEFIRRVIACLMERRGIDLSILVRFKYPLIKVLAEKIKEYRQQAYFKGYQETLFGPKAAVETSYGFSFDYGKDSYAPAWYYSGRYRFKKHFYPTIGELESDGEEFDCAQIIDGLPPVKHWVRNLPNQPHASFWLPTATDRFYPDFVAELQDGRILVVEYKGKPYVTNDDSKEKRNLGELWEEKSHGKGLFLMAEKRDAQGRDVYMQLMEKMNNN